MSTFSQTALHVFEQAGLGRAPFRFVGYEEKKYQACHGAPIQPGACCDYCGTAIIGCCWIRSADGKRFKVGCDCVSKTDDKGLVDVVKRAVNKIKTAARHAKEAEKIEAGKAKLALPEVQEALKAQPHPWALREDPAAWVLALTRLDWARWMMQNAGSKGRLEVCKVLEML